MRAPQRAARGGGDRTTCPCYARRPANGLSHRGRLYFSALGGSDRKRPATPGSAALATPSARGASAPPTGGSADSLGRLFLGITRASLYSAGNSHRTPSAALGRRHLPGAGTGPPLSCATKTDPDKVADSANRAWLTGRSFLDSAKTGEGRRQRGQNLWRICSLLGLWPRGEEAGKRSEGARIPSTDSPRPPDESAPVQRTTQISPALAGLLPSAPPPFPQGLVAASVAADSSRTPGQSSWIVVVKPTLRGMRPISRFPGPHLSSLKGRRPRRSRFPRPRGSPGGTHGESANVDVVLAGPHAG